MKTYTLLIAALALIATASADLKKLQGTWKATAGRMGATELPKSMTEKMILVVKGRIYDYDEGNGHDIGTLKEMGGKAPLALDITGTEGPNKGLMFPAIYKIEGSMLVISYGLDGHRPTSFGDKTNKKILTMSFRRAR